MPGFRTTQDEADKYHRKDGMWAESLSAQARDSIAGSHTCDERRQHAMNHVDVSGSPCTANGPLFSCSRVFVVVARMGLELEKKLLSGQ